MARLAVLALLAASACLRPAEDRALADLDAGRVDVGGVAFSVDDNLAAVRGAAPGRLTLWAQAPILRIRAEPDAGATAMWTITVNNAMPTARLTATTDGGQVVPATALGGPRATTRAWELALPVDEPVTLEVAPPDAGDLSPWRFAFLADIQEGVGDVGDIYQRMNEDPSIRFVLFGGDLTDRGERAEYERNIAALERLEKPMYLTLGNHELFGDDGLWDEYFGARNFHFAYRGVHVTFVDSASATIDPRVYDRLDDWLAQAAGDIHVYVSHYPPFDPIGVREGGFRNRNEAAKLVSRLARGGVDAIFVGHIHSYYAEELHGIPMWIAGGGGATPQERLDGVGRHYLTIDVEPQERISQVALVRID